MEKERKIFKDLILDKKAKFKYRTKRIFTNLLKCRILCYRSHLRKNRHTRQDLYFKIGQEHLEKEMDISRIMMKIR